MNACMKHHITSFSSPWEKASCSNKAQRPKTLVNPEASYSLYTTQPTLAVVVAATDLPTDYPRK